jgi:uncharacterized OsmC-like protein
MVEMNIVYVGEKHCELTHGPSKSVIETDAPKDNHGRGERFSPTDLMGASLASCALTTMAIKAEKDGVKIDGARARVEKHMQSDPRRIASLPLEITMPPGIPTSYRAKIKEFAETCPVKLSLHPSVETPVRIVYPD